MRVRVDVGHVSLDRGPASDAIACAVALDDRPLRGPAGLADWRLCGLLSRQIMAGRYEGRLGEDMLIAAAPRLPYSKLFLIGLGRASEIDESLARQVVSRTAGVLLKVGAGSAKLGLWDLTREHIPFEEGFEAFLSGLSREAARGVEAETFALHLLARSPTESGRIAHFLEQRVTQDAPPHLDLASPSR